MRRTAFLLLVSAVATLLQAQTLDPAATLLLHQQAFHAPQRDGATAADAAQVSVYVRYDADRTDWHAIAALEGKVGVCADGLATVRLPESQLSALSQVRGISYIQAPQQAHLMLDLARTEAYANEAQELLLTLNSSSTPTLLTTPGSGIIIGQVDAGIDYTHHAFRTPDGTLRIARVWEQGTDPATAPIAGLHSPAGFSYGAEFDTPELILQAGGDSDAGSHGTHVMGIAAGSDTYLDGQYRGLAPGAELVMVAITDVGADNVHISDAIKYIFDYADQVGKPCVINLSLGANSGPHDGTSPFDRIADALQGPGRLIVGAAGNYGADKFHISRTIDQSLTGFQTILNHEFYTSHIYGDIDLWAAPTLSFRLELYDLSTFSGTENEVKVFDLATLLDGSVHDVTLGRNVTGKIQLTGEANPLNGKTHVLLRSFITNIRNNHTVALRIVPVEGEGQIDLWADDAKIFFNAPERDGYVNPTTESTVAEIGGTARRILSVGAYTTRDQFQLEGKDQWFPVGMDLQELSKFSGFGPTADGRQKPEVCAPGSIIVSACNGYDISGEIYMHSHYTDLTGHPQRYGYMQGTSMSAPFVTGAVALWLQAYPSLTPEELKEVIAHSSRQDEFTTDVRYWGAGKVNVLAGLQRCIELRDNNSAISEVHTSPQGEAGRGLRGLFDLSGRRITSPRHGFYVVNGKVIRATASE